MEISSAVRALAPKPYAARAAPAAATTAMSDPHLSSIFTGPRTGPQVFGAAVAVSAAMNEVFAILRRLAPSQVTIANGASPRYVTCAADVGTSRP